jgi:hypothetical protein
MLCVQIFEITPQLLLNLFLSTYSIDAVSRALQEVVLSI